MQPDPEKLDSIVEPQLERETARKTVPRPFVSRSTCKICKSEKRAEIEALWQEFNQTKSRQAILKAINQNFDPSINDTSVRTHFGLNKNPTTGGFRKSHFIADVVAKNVSTVIQEQADRMISEKASDVAVEDLKAGMRRVGMRWLQQLEGSEMRMLMLDDRVGAALLAKSIDADFDEKAIALKRSQGNQMNQILLGQLGMMAAIFGTKKPAEFIEATVAEPQKLPEARSDGT